jgi:hypothetical protein
MRCKKTDARLLWYCCPAQKLVPTARLELAQLSPLPPQDSVSTNFTTSAFSLLHERRALYLMASIELRRSKKIYGP